MAKFDIYDRRRFLVQAGAVALFLSAEGMPQAGWAQAAEGSDKKIGVIGSGNIGAAVGSLWVKAGHPVLFSSRHPEELKGLVDGLGPLAKAGTVAEAAAFGDIVFIAVPYSALPQVGRDNQAALAGKVVLDACNAIANRDGDIVNEVKANGVGATSAKYLPDTHLARTFNPINYKTVASENRRAGQLIGMPIASDDPKAIQVATALVREAGFEPVVMPLSRAGDFGPGSPLAGQVLTAPELRQRLGLAQ